MPAQLLFLYSKQSTRDTLLVTIQVTMGKARSTTTAIGWAEADITPDKKVLLAGQFYARVSEGIEDPITATALAIESTFDSDAAEAVVFVSCDIASISDTLRDAIRDRVRDAVPELKPWQVIIGATHSHAAPDARSVPYGMEGEGDYVQRVKSTGRKSAKPNQYGMWPDLEFDAMTVSDYVDFAAERIATAVATAWQHRSAGGIAHGLGHAVVSRNRRLIYADGSGKMYGKPGTADFRHVEGYEDHSVHVVATYDEGQALTGLIVNVACPAQVSEHSFLISADYWHETRQELRCRFGEKIHILGQCAPAGDLSPHVLIGKRAEQRMWRLKGLNTDQNTPRAEIANRIANAVSDVLPWAEKEIDWNPVCNHRTETLQLPRRKVSEADVEAALKEAEPYKKDYERLLAEIETNPDFRNDKRWYVEVSKAYRRMERGERVKERYALQQRSPAMPVELHVGRIGAVAFATNPFELYLDYALRIKELSPADQTLLVQKSGCNGTYLASERSISHGGYGSVPASTDIGPEGGEMLVEWTVNGLKELWRE